MSLVDPTIQLTPYNDYKWVLNTKEGRNILINQNTLDLILILKKALNKEQAYEYFNDRFGLLLSFEQFLEIINDRLGGYNILIGDNKIKKSQLNDYVKFKIPILPANLARKLAEPLSYFYSPKIFWTSFSMLLFFAIIFLGWHISTGGFNNQIEEIFFLMLLIYPSTLLHELGHIAACRKFNVKNGKIGFGFYLVFPVFYADISNIWMATKKQRLIANLAGIYAELFYAFCLCLLFLYTQNFGLLSVSALIIIAALMELNPFARSDGYWVLSDFFDTPNLIKKSNQQIKYSFKNRKKILRHPILFFKNNINKWLLLYGACNQFVISFLVIGLVISLRIELLTFPSNLWNAILRIINRDFENIDISYVWLLYIFLYYYFFQQLFNIVQIFLVKKNKTRNNKYFIN